MGFALFELNGDQAVPLPGAGSPWMRDTLNGAAVSALLSCLAERHPAPFANVCARMSIEFLRPVPRAPLTCQFEVLREGRKQQVLRLSLGAEGQVSATATCVRLRVEPCAVDDVAPVFEPAPGEPFQPTVGKPGGMLDWIDGRLEPRPNLAHRRGWLCYRGEIIAGVPLTPWSRMGLFADFGNGMAPLKDAATHTFLNAELTLHLARLPTTPWIHLDCRTIDGGEGIGMTRIVFADVEGDFGYAHQSLLFETR